MNLLQRRNRKAAFTLLEIMVAVAILGLSLAAIFSAEAGAIHMASRSGKMGTAALLARCKMLELEELVAREGLPAIFKSDSDQCCEDAEISGYRCDWEINLVVLPDAMFNPEADEEELEEAEDSEQDAPGSGFPGSESAGFSIPLGTGVNTSEVLSGGGSSGLASMAMQQVYPILKPAFEAQIRRATVTVSWKEGRAEKSFDINQYIVAQEGVAPELEEEADDKLETGTEASSTESSTSE